MLRRLPFILAAFAAFASAVAFADTIPQHINPHNGYIVVQNDVELRGGAVGDFDFYLLLNGRIIDHVRVPAGGTGYFNKCCILAGTMYDFMIDTRGTVKSPVRPQLCNVRGIPFGYAVVKFTGHLTYAGLKEGFASSYTPHVPTVSCPTS